jgi:hypothetical protein
VPGSEQPLDENDARDWVERQVPERDRSRARPTVGGESEPPLMNVTDGRNAVTRQRSSVM